MKWLYLSGFRFSYSTERYVAWSLRQAGQEVLCLPLRGRLSSSLSVQQRRVLALQPDVVLFSKTTSPSFTKLIDWCREQRITTACWLWDLFFGYRPSRPPQMLADIVFSTDGGHDQDWKDYGANHQVLRQGIHLPEHQWVDPEPVRDVAFIGSGHSYPGRRSLVRWLARHCRGRYRYVHYTQTRGTDLNRALSGVKVVVGDSYPASHYWSNRIYEVLGRGGFLLHPNTEGLDTEFEDGVHYASYPRRDFGALARRIRHYVTHDEEREQIRRAGFDLVGAQYTYCHRVRQLIEAVARLRAERLGSPVEVR